MTKAATKPKAGKKTAKPAKPKLEVVKPGIGHNSNGQVVPGLVKLVDELLHIDEQKKAMSKAERDCRNRAKTEFGILSGTLAHEMRLRKMDPDVRVQFESNHSDLKVALGYQPELDFVNGQPTRASYSQQLSEKEIAATRQGDEESFEVNDDEEDYEKAPAVNEDQENDKEEMEVPAFLKRKAGVIEREG